MCEEEEEDKDEMKATFGDKKIFFFLKKNLLKFVCHVTRDLNIKIFVKIYTFNQIIALIIIIINKGLKL